MLLRYAVKSVKVMVQFGVAGVLGLLCAVLLYSTIQRWRFESTLREAAAASATGDGDAPTKYKEASDLHPDDPWPLILFGQHLLERGQKAVTDAALAQPEQKEKDLDRARKMLEQAVKQFDGALAKVRDAGPANNDQESVLAVAGGSAARLALADATPDRKAALIDEAAKNLEQVSSDDVELTIVKAGLALAKGDNASGSKLLAEASGRLGQAGRDASASYYWNHGLLLLMAKDPECATELERSALLRHAPENGRLLSLAARIVCADPSVASKSNEELERRCLNMGLMVKYRPKKGDSRFRVDKLDEAKVWNAAGMGLLRAGNPDKAVEAFTQAKNAAPKEVLFSINLALAMRAQGEKPPADQDPVKYRNEQLGRAGGVLSECARAIKDQPEKEKYGQDLLQTAAYYYWLGMKPTYAGAAIVMAHENSHLEEKEFERQIGAINDYENRLDLAVPHYRNAIKLQAKESFKMEIRIENFLHPNKK